MLTFDSHKLTLVLTECLKCLQTLEDCYMVEEKFTSGFKGFLRLVNDCFSELRINTSVISSSPCKNKILLCLSQVLKSLKLFTLLLRKPLYRQGVWYVCERLRWCLTELRQACCSPDLADDCAGDSGWFLRHVDVALQLLEEQAAAAVRDSRWTQLLNDIICQAVTIAKIATPLDYKEITSACQGILHFNSQLVNEDQTNSNQLSLLSDSLFNSLISLEERVNVAVLRLVLQVFCEPCRPVKQLVRQCGHAPSSRSLSDLDPAVAEIDSHIERVMLIGQFAVSCCEDTVRVRGVRSCLASVESIDNYLVPALKALYLTPDCDDKRMFARLLCDHWQDEANALHSHLDRIIDSAAFSKVVQESVHELSGRLSGEESWDGVAKLIIKQCWLLYTHLAGADGVLASDLDQLKQSVCECEASVNKKAPHSAVAKRVRLVVAAVDKLTDQLANTQLSIQLPTVGETASDSPPVAKSLRDISLDISLSSTKSNYASYRPQWLKQKICDVKKNIIKDPIHLKNVTRAESIRTCIVDSANTPKRQQTRNVCETPKNIVKNEGDPLTPYLSKTAERTTTLYVRTPRRVIQNQMMDETPVTDCSWSTVNGSDSLALEISDILDNLSTLADTLSSNKESEAVGWQQPQPTPPADVMKRYFSGSSFDSQWFSLASVRTEEVSADVDTPERIQDLKDVDEKIRRLQLL